MRAGLPAAGIVVIACACVGADATAADGRPTTGRHPVVRQLDQASLTADADTATVRTTLPVPRGRRVVGLSARLEPRRSGVGTIEVLVGDTVVRRTQARDERIGLPVPAAVQRAGGDLSLGLRYRVDNRCRANTEQVVLTHPRLSLTGTTEPPRTVGTFFDDAVSRVTVVVPDAADDAVAGAGLAAVGSLAGRYGSDTPVTLLPASMVQMLDTGDRVAPRVVRLVPAATGAVRVRVVPDAAIPTLELRGPADRLSRAAAALGDERLVLADDAAVDGLTAGPTSPSALRRTFASLGHDPISVGGRGPEEVQVGIRQSDLGGPVSSLRIALRGTHTAVASGSTSVVDVLWNGQLVDSTRLSPTDDAYRRAFTIPGHRLGANGTLTLRLRTLTCRRDAPVQLDIDGGASTVTGTRGDSMADGLQRFPQVLGTTLPVVLGHGTSRRAVLRSAAALVVALQRQTAQRLDVRVMPMARFRSAGLSGLVVGADAADSDALAAPFRLRRFRAINAQDVRFGVGTDRPYAALASFRSGGRDVLMLGGWAPRAATSADVVAGLEVALARRAADAEGGWVALSRDLAVLGDPTAKPALLDVNAIVPQKSVADDYRSEVRWPLIAIAIVVLVGLLRAFLVRRRRRRVARYVDAQEHADASSDRP